MGAPGFNRAPAGSTYQDLSNGNIYIQAGGADSINWTLMVNGATKGVTFTSTPGTSLSSTGGTGSLSGATGLTSTSVSMLTTVSITGFNLASNASNTTSPITVNNGNFRTTSLFDASINNVTSTGGTLCVKDITPTTGSVNVIVTNVGNTTFNGGFELLTSNMDKIRQ